MGKNREKSDVEDEISKRLLCLIEDENIMRYRDLIDRVSKEDVPQEWHEVARKMHCFFYFYLQSKRRCSKKKARG